MYATLCDFESVKWSTCVLVIVLIAVSVPFLTTIQPIHNTQNEKLSLTYFDFGITSGTILQNLTTQETLLPNSSKAFKTETSKGKILIISSNTDLEDELQVDLEGPVSRIFTNIIYSPTAHIYYSQGDGEVRIIIKNPQDQPVHYTFNIDTSEPLCSHNSKSIPLEDGRVAFHVDLRVDDGVSLNLDPSLANSHFRIRVFALCLEIAKGKSTYTLCLHKQTNSSNNLYFDADLGGRYYIIIESIKGVGAFSLRSVITSPFWNQDWFWLAFNIVLLTGISSLFLTRLEKIRRLEKARLYAVLGYYCCFLAIIVSISLIGSFNYTTLIFMPLLCLLLFTCVLSLGILIYASYLDRSKATETCPYCGREVNFKREVYCCGKKIKDPSPVWYLLPLSLSFLFYIIGYLFYSWNLIDYTFPLSLEVGGTIIGGIISWWINRPIYRRAWVFLATGLVFCFLSPLLIAFLVDMSFRQHVVLDIPGRLLRIRVAPLTIAHLTIIGYSALIAGFVLSLVHRIREVLSSKQR